MFSILAEPIYIPTISVQVFIETKRTQTDGKISHIHGSERMNVVEMSILL